MRWWPGAAVRWRRLGNPKEVRDPFERWNYTTNWSNQTIAATFTSLPFTAAPQKYFWVVAGFASPFPLEGVQRERRFPVAREVATRIHADV